MEARRSGATLGCQLPWTRSSPDAGLAAEWVDCCGGGGGGSVCVVRHMGVRHMGAPQAPMYAISAAPPQHPAVQDPKRNGSRSSPFHA